MKLSGQFNLFMILLTLVSGALTACVPVQARLEIALSDLAIQPTILTDTPELLQIGPISADDLEQPLNRSAAELSRQADGVVLSYREAYRVQGFDQKRGVYVGNYLYRYIDSSQAQAAAQAFLDAAAEHQSKLLSQVPGGQAVLLTGSSGDGLYWYCGVQDNVLILLMVNGPLSPETLSSFEQLVEALPVKSFSQ